MPNASGTLRRFRFDQLATQVNDRVDDPAASGVERYVGLEHLDADSLSIRRWGEITDVESTKLRFQPGDIIFGKRRVYQRKLAVADFEGICSAHAMVLRAKPDVVDPGFLPYFMQSDRFMERALSISVGSLSPTINWKDLAQQEFALPPIEEQRRVAVALLAADATADAGQNVRRRAQEVYQSLVEERCWRGGFPLRSVVELASPEWGEFRDGDWIESKDQSDRGIRLLQLADIGRGDFLDKSSRFISEGTFARLGCTEVKPGDLLIARMADPIGRTCAVPLMPVRCITAVDCCIARLDASKHDYRYWLAVLNSKTWTSRVAALAAGSTRTRISRTNLQGIQVPIPDTATQRHLGDSLDEIRRASALTENRASHLARLRERLMASITESEH